MLVRSRKNVVSLSQCGVYITALVEQGGLALFDPNKAASCVRRQEQPTRSEGGWMGAHLVFKMHTPPILEDVTIQAVCGCSLGWVDGPNGRQQESTLFGRDHL